MKDACELGERLNVENLILYHTEDKNILKRQEMYLAEGRKFYHGNLYVPEDLDVIELWDRGQRQWKICLCRTEDLRIAAGDRQALLYCDHVSLWK